MTDDDPLAGAAVGETCTFEHSTVVNTVDALPAECYGRDRDLEADIASVDIFETPHPEDPDDVRITYEVELTQHLPPRWDECDEPRTDAERRRDRRLRWARRGGRFIAFWLPFAIAAPVAAIVTKDVFQEATVNGQPIQPPSLAALTGYVLALAAFVWFLKWAVSGGIPPMRVNHR